MRQNTSQNKNYEKPSKEEVISMARFRNDLGNLGNDQGEIVGENLALNNLLKTPENLDKKTLLSGQTCYLGSGVDEILGLDLGDRRRHVYVLGKTGMGKTTLLENMILQDIYSGFGVCFVDAHGDASEYILSKIPPHREQDLIYFDPSDSEFPIGLNILEAQHGEDLFLIAGSLMAVFKKIWAGLWSTRMEYILYNTLLAILESNLAELAFLSKTSETANRKAIENTVDKITQKNNKSQSQISPSKSVDSTTSSIAKTKSRLETLSHRIALNNLSTKNTLQKTSDPKTNTIPNFDAASFESVDKSFSLPNNSSLELVEQLSQEIDLQFSSEISDKSSSRLNVNYKLKTLLAVVKMLTDEEYTAQIVDQISDPIVKNFWLKEYASFNARYQQEAISPILNKIGQFLSSKTIRFIVGQNHSSLNFREIMDSGKILLVNLSKGKLGEDNSNLLGSLIVSKIQLAAMSRVDTPEANRRDFFLYVDEFQNFTNESFAEILSESRKYRLNLTLAHQYLDQLTTIQDKAVRSAIFGNVGSIICFQVGASDAEIIAKEFNQKIRANTLLDLTSTQAAFKLAREKTKPIIRIAKTLPPLFEEQFEETFKKAQDNEFEELDKSKVTNSGSSESIIIKNPKNDRSERLKQLSRKKYGRAWNLVEDQIKIYFDSNKTFSKKNTKKTNKYKK